MVKGEKVAKGRESCRKTKCVSSCNKNKTSRKKVMSLSRHEKVNVLGFGAELNEAQWAMPSDEVMRSIWSQWTKKEKTLLRKMTSPTRIQEYLDSLGYDPSDGIRSVRTTMSIGKAHCAAGTLMAYYLMTRLGYECTLMGIDACNDDGHAIMAFRVKAPSGLYQYGSIAKSNFSGLKCRDAVFSSLRELMMSYYNFHFNVPQGEKTLTGWNGPWSGWAFGGSSNGRECHKAKKGEDVRDVYPWLFSGELCDKFEKAWDDGANQYEVLLPQDEIRKEGKKQPTTGNRRIEAFMLASSNLVESGKLGGNPDGYYHA